MSRSIINSKKNNTFHTHMELDEWIPDVRVAEAMSVDTLTPSYYLSSVSLFYRRASGCSSLLQRRPVEAVRHFPVSEGLGVIVTKPRLLSH